MPHLNRRAGMCLTKPKWAELVVGRWDPSCPLSFKILYYFHRIQSRPPLFEYSRSAPGQGLLLVKDYYNYKSFLTVLLVQLYLSKENGKGVSI